MSITRITSVRRGLIGPVQDVFGGARSGFRPVLLALAPEKPETCQQQKYYQGDPMAGGMHYMRGPFKLVSDEIADGDYQ